MKIMFKQKTDIPIHHLETFSLTLENKDSQDEGHCGLAVQIDLGSKLLQHT